MKIRFLRSARRELESAVAHYHSLNAAAASAFRKEVSDALTRISEQPLPWPAMDANTRRCLCTHFPYGLIYRINDDTAMILAVAHTRRKPGYWETATP